MRKTPVGAEGFAPAPATCGVKNRAATLDITTKAVNPWKFGTDPRIANPGILDRAHSIGKVIGVLPRTLKSKALCVYFQMYSPSRTKYRPNACERPAWNSLRWPGLSGVVDTHAPPGTGVWSALITGSLHPRLARTRFSLNGVSMVRA